MNDKPSAGYTFEQLQGLVDCLLCHEIDGVKYFFLKFDSDGGYPSAYYLDSTMDTWECYDNGDELCPEDVLDVMESF